METCDRTSRSTARNTVLALTVLGSGWLFLRPTNAARPQTDGPCGTVATYCVPLASVAGCTAALALTGTPSASASSGYTITVNGADPFRTGLLFYGITGPLPGPPFSALCVKPPTQRMGLQNTGGSAGGCDGTLSVDWNAYRASHPGALGSPYFGGETVHAQGYIRDPLGPGGAALSNAVEFVVCP